MLKAIPYRISGIFQKNLTQPHIMVLSDVHNAFVPLLEGFLVTLSEAEALVDW